MNELERALKNPQRLLAVRASEMLDSPPDQAIDDLAQEASHKLRAPLVVFTLVDRYRDFVLAHVGLPAPQATAREVVDSPSFCQLTVAQGETLVINDTLDSSMLRMFPSVRQAGVRAHLGVPILIGGQPVGNCCVIDFEPREWTANDISTLTRLAEQVTQRIQTVMARLKLAGELG